MKTFFEKSKTILLLVGIVFLSFAVVKNHARLEKAKETVNEARTRVETLKKEEETLNNQLVEAQSAEFIEKQIRDKLGLAKEGEIVLVLPEESAIRSLAPKRKPKEEYQPEPNWKKWKQLFF